MIYVVDFFSDKVYLSGEFLYPVSQIFTPLGSIFFYFGGVFIIIGASYFNGHLSKLFRLIRKASPWMKFSLMLSTLLFISMVLFLGELLFYSFIIIYIGYIVSLIMQKHWLFFVPLFIFIGYASSQFFLMNQINDFGIADGIFIYSTISMIIVAGILAIMGKLNKTQPRFTMEIFLGFFAFVVIYFLFSYAFVVNSPEPSVFDDYVHPVF
jgi:hypothetical protein